MTKDESTAENLGDSNTSGGAPRSHQRRRLGARREASKHETREALVAAAMAAFAEDGLDNPSLDAICARAGYTRGAFYVHFRDREDLIAAVSERFLGRLLEVVGEGSESDSLDDSVSKLMKAVTKPGPVPAHQFLHACARSKVLRTRYVEALGQISGRLQEAASQARPDLDSTRVAWMVLAVITGLQTLLEAKAPVNVAAVSQLLSSLLER